MVCKECGQTIQDGEIICPHCGAMLVELKIPEIIAVDGKANGKNDNSESEYHRPITLSEGLEIKEYEFRTLQHKRKMRIGILIGAVCTAVLISGLIIFNRKPKKDEYTCYNEHSFWFISYDGVEGRILYYDQSEKPCKLLNYSGYQANQDSTLYGALDSNNELYLMNDSDSEALRSHVSIYALSGEGTKIAYITANMNDTYDLYLYDIKKKQENLVDSGVSNQPIVISPDGKAIMYRKSAEFYEDEETYLYNDGKKKYLGDNIVPVAVANGGNIMYYQDNDIIYGMQKGKEPVELINHDLYEIYLNFNLDCSEMLYYKEDGTYLCKDGFKMIQLSSDNVCTLLTPEDITTRSVDIHIAGYPIYYLVYGLQTFTNKLHINCTYNDEKIRKSVDAFYLNDDDQVVTIENVDTFNARFSSDVKSFIYLDDNNLYYVSDFTKKNYKPKKLVEDEVVAYQNSKDFKILYYASADGKLYRKEWGKDSVLIAEQVIWKDTMKQFFDELICYDDNNDTIYFHCMKDNEDHIYYSNQGNAAEEIYGADRMEHPDKMELRYYYSGVQYIECSIMNDNYSAMEPAYQRTYYVLNNGEAVKENDNEVRERYN